MIRRSVSRFPPHFFSSCSPSRDKLRGASIRRRRYPKSRVLSLLPHGQARCPYLSLLGPLWALAGPPGRPPDPRGPAA
eukprot:2490932-Pyramimonas_sp.AAC.1